MKEAIKKIIKEESLVIENELLHLFGVNAILKSEGMFLS